MEGIRVNDEDENTQGKKKRKKEREFFYENESLVTKARIFNNNSL